MKRVEINGVLPDQEKVVGEPGIGVAKNQFEIPDSFFEPLPDEFLQAFDNDIIFEL